MKMSTQKMLFAFVKLLEFRVAVLGYLCGDYFKFEIPPVKLLSFVSYESTTDVKQCLRQVDIMMHDVLMLHNVLILHNVLGPHDVVRLHDVPRYFEK